MSRKRRGESGNTGPALSFLQDFSEHFEMICSNDRVRFKTRRILFLVDNCIPEPPGQFSLGNTTRQKTPGKAAQSRAAPPVTPPQGDFHP